MSPNVRVLRSRCCVLNTVLNTTAPKGDFNKNNKKHLQPSKPTKLTQPTRITQPKLGLIEKQLEEGSQGSDENQDRRSTFTIPLRKSLILSSLGKSVQFKDVSNPPFMAVDAPKALWPNKVGKKIKKDLKRLQPANQKSAQRCTTSSVKKVPNFAAIHKKNLDQIESIKAYSDRKQERAACLLAGKRPETTPIVKAKKNLNFYTNQFTNQAEGKNKGIKRLGDAKRGTKEILKGVRTNKRFDLMMQHCKKGKS